MADRYDLIVIGAGPGGYVAAIRAAQLGMKVACVDKSPTLGGTCLNIGCIPSKALLESSELYYLARTRFQHHGIRMTDVACDVQKMLGRKDKIVKGLSDGIAFLFKKNKIAPVQGRAKLLGNGRVGVENGTVGELSAGALVLATGSVPAPLPFLPFDGTTIVSSTEALSFPSVPEHLLVIGGGYIGLELGSVWARLGARVTVLEFLPRILAPSDGELVGLLQKSLVSQGIEFHVATRVTGATRKGKQVTLQAERDGKTVEFTGDRVLVAAGRKPCSSGLGLEEQGIQLESKSGRVLVDDRYQTNVPGVYAIGDLIAGPMLAHKAQEEGVAVAELLAGKAGHVNYAAIPSVIYTAPELASVGLTEDQLKEAQRKYRVGKFLFANNGRARCLDETEGVVKVLTDADTDRILGVHILGARASELIAEAVLAMEFSGSAEDIARTCHAHPTLSEAMGEAARAAWSAPLHA